MMNPNEIDIDLAQATRLIAAQFPEWADLPVTAVRERGTDHALYRIGTDLVARLPRVPDAVDQVESDRTWLPLLAPHLPLPVPVPIAVGEPGEGYPWPWTVAPWIEGRNPSPDDDLIALAVDLAGFVTAMGQVDPSAGPVKTGISRGVPLANRDELIRTSIAQLGDRIDGRAVTAAWDQAIGADPWPDPPVWVHGDLLEGNLLMRGSRLSAVIDFGALGLGDPAIELLPAWYFFDERARSAYREALGVDDATWVRGWGWVLSIQLYWLADLWDRLNPADRADDLRTLDMLLSHRSRLGR